MFTPYLWPERTTVKQRHLEALRAPAYVEIDEANNVLVEIQAKDAANWHWPTRIRYVVQSLVWLRKLHLLLVGRQRVLWQQMRETDDLENHQRQEREMLRAKHNLQAAEFVNVLQAHLYETKTVVRSDSSGGIYAPFNPFETVPTMADDQDDIPF